MWLGEERSDLNGSEELTEEPVIPLNARYLLISQPAFIYKLYLLLSPQQLLARRKAYVGAMPVEEYTVSLSPDVLSICSLMNDTCQIMLESSN